MCMCHCLPPDCKTSDCQSVVVAVLDTVNAICFSVAVFSPVSLALSVLLCQFLDASKLLSFLTGFLSCWTPAYTMLQPLTLPTPLLHRLQLKIIAKPNNEMILLMIFVMLYQITNFSHNQSIMFITIMDDSVIVGERTDPTRWTNRRLEGQTDGWTADRWQFNSVYGH